MKPVKPPKGMSPDPGECNYAMGWLTGYLAAIEWLPGAQHTNDAVCVVTAAKYSVLIIAIHVPTQYLPLHNRSPTKTATCEVHHIIWSFQQKPHEYKMGGSGPICGLHNYGFSADVLQEI